MKTVMSSKGQIVLPAALRKQDDIRPGQEFEVQRLDQGEYLLKRTKRRRDEGFCNCCSRVQPRAGFDQPTGRPPPMTFRFPNSDDLPR
jgi:AbrB family looped-hinge helix DNA binding protein